MLWLHFDIQIFGASTFRNWNLDRDVKCCLSPTIIFQGFAVIGTHFLHIFNFFGNFKRLLFLFWLFCRAINLLWGLILLNLCGSHFLIFFLFLWFFLFFLDLSHSGSTFFFFFISFGLFLFLFHICLPSFTCALFWRKSLLMHPLIFFKKLIG